MAIKHLHYNNLHDKLLRICNSQTYQQFFVFWGVVHQLSLQKDIVTLNATGI